MHAVSRRLLHSSARPLARLVDSSVSVAPEYGRTTPPEPPTQPFPTPVHRPPRPPLPATHKGPVRPGTATVHEAAAAPAPPPPPTRGPIRPGAPITPAAPAPIAQTPAQDEHERAVSFDLFLLRTLAQLSERNASAATRPDERREWADLESLLCQQREREGRVLEDVTLEHESTPGPARRIRLDGRSGVEQAVQAAGGTEMQDGVVVVAHVLGGADTRVSICSGFAVGKASGEEGQLICSCAHTLESMRQYLRPSSSAVPSATFVLASSGHVYTVSSLTSSLSESDLLLLRLSPTPINPSATPILPLRTLPINPYPPPPSARVSVHRYLNPLSRLRRKLQRLPEREWDEGRVAEYKDAIGRTAEVGTYDHLAAMWLSCCPTPGSSGGPVVDQETGSVVGITRGSTHQHGERQRYGFATPAERLFELFRLPGFKTTAERHAERAAQQAREEDETGEVRARGSRAQGQ